jgi:transposase
MICGSLRVGQKWGLQMGKSHPLALRERVVAFVEDRNTHRSAAAHFRVSIKFVNDMVILKRETGALAPKPQGNPGRGKLGALSDWVRGRIEAQGDLTLDDLVLELHHEHRVKVLRASVGRWLHRLGRSHKKTLLAAEQMRPDVAQARTFWINRRQPFMRTHLERLAFIDETSLKTNMIKTTGWAPVGQRLIDHTPFGHWTPRLSSLPCATTGWTLRG